MFPISLSCVICAMEIDPTRVSTVLGETVCKWEYEQACWSINLVNIYSRVVFPSPTRLCILVFAGKAAGKGKPGSQVACEALT